MTSPETETGCGECRLCCKLLAVEADEGGGQIFKPALKWCTHALQGVGCAIYARRPQACRTFECTWLASQRGEGADGSPWDRMPAAMRPDRCGVIFGPSDPVDPEKVFHIHCEPMRPLAWARRDVKSWIERIVGRGITVVLSVGEKHTTLRKDLPNMRRNSS
jgi:hypothetical protein